MKIPLSQKFSLQTMSGALSEKYGITRKLTAPPGECFPSGIRSYLAQASMGKEFGGVYRGGSGTNLNFFEAQISAMGEALERYGIGLPLTCLHGDAPISYLGLGPKNCIEPGTMRYFSKTQFKNPEFNFVEFTKDIPIFWAKGKDLRTNSNVWVPEPAVSVYIRKSPPLFDNTTSGLGLSDSAESAIKSGLLEIVERDSVMGFWWNKISAPRIRPNSIDDDVSRRILDSLRAADYEIYILNQTSDLGIPVVATVARGRSPNQPSFLMAAACRPTYSAAIRKALIELTQIFSYFRHLKSRGNLIITTQWDDDVKSFDDAVRLHSLPQMKFHHQFFVEGIEMDCPPSDLAENSGQKELAQIIDKAGYRVASVDLTSVDLAKLGLNLQRVVIPGLIPINYAHRNRPFGVARLYDFKKRLKLSPNDIVESDLNPAPHPFP